MTVPYAAIQEIVDLVEQQLENIDPDEGVEIKMYLDADDAERAKRKLAEISAWLNTLPTNARYPWLDKESVS
jgi:hypothetical protein